MEMVNADKKFRERIDRLKSNLCISLLVYEKYQAIFKDLFNGPHQPAVDEPKKTKKAARSSPCTANKVYEFCWYLFVSVKSKYPENSVDMVTTFHMLLCCVDMVFASAVAEGRTDLLKKDWMMATLESAAASDDADKTTAPTSVTKPVSIMKALCEQYNGTYIDAIVTQTCTWRPVVDDYMDKHLLRADRVRPHLGLLAVDNFESNLNSIKRIYEAYVLSVGEVDEGILLAQIGNNAMNQSKKKKKQFLYII